MYQVTAKWTILPGKKREALAAIKKLSDLVKKNEPDTLAYLPNSINLKETNLPIPNEGEILFFEIYKDKEAFLNHVNGAIFENFVAQYKDLFLCGFDGSPFMILQNLTSENGFIREALTKSNSFK